MKALFFKQHGDQNVLEIGDLPDPKPGPHDVVVQIYTASLNHLDIWVRKGLPGLSLSMPHIQGCDGAGVIVALGQEVKHLNIGDEVILNPLLSCGHCDFCLRGEQSLCTDFGILGETRSGTFAEYITVPAQNVLPKPDSLDWPTAAAFPLVFTTAWRLLMTRAQLRPGETILITGIGGGVAMAALDIAQFLGCKIFVTSSQAEKIYQAKKKGAHEGFLYTDPDWAKQVRKATQGRGVDVVCDSAGGDSWTHGLKTLKKGGRFVTCGATQDPMPPADIQRIFWNQLSILGSTMGSYADFQAVVTLISQGKLKPTIDRTFPLDQAKKAIALMEKGGQCGKIILTMPVFDSLHHSSTKAVNLKKTNEQQRLSQALRDNLKKRKQQSRARAEQGE